MNLKIKIFFGNEALLPMSYYFSAMKNKYHKLKSNNNSQELGKHPKMKCTTTLAPLLFFLFAKSLTFAHHMIKISSFCQKKELKDREKVVIAQKQRSSVCVSILLVPTQHLIRMEEYLSIYYYSYLFLFLPIEFDFLRLKYSND